MAVNGQTQWIGARPVPSGEGGVVQKGCSGADKNSLVSCSHAVNKRLCQSIGEKDGLFLPAPYPHRRGNFNFFPFGEGWGETAILALCPLECYPGSVLLVEREETVVQLPALLFQDTHDNFASCVLQFPDA